MQYFSWTTPVNACIGPDIIHFTHSSLIFFSRTCRRPMPHMNISRITRFSLMHGRGIDHHYYAHFISVLFFFHFIWLPYTLNLTFFSYSTHMSTWFIFPLPSCNSRWFVWLVKWSIIFHFSFFVHILNQFLHLDCTLHFSWHFRVFSYLLSHDPSLPFTLCRGFPIDPFLSYFPFLSWRTAIYIPPTSYRLLAFCSPCLVADVIADDTLR